MIIIDDLIAAGVTYLAVEGIIWGINKFKEWSLKRKTKEFRVKPELTDEDRALIEKCREVMKETFPEGIEKRFRSLSLNERTALLRKMILELNGIYGVNVRDIAFLHSREIGEGTLGYYDIDSNCIRFNVDYIDIDNPELWTHIIGTVFHELRHALQYRAVTDSSCNYGTQEQLRLWALNLVNYIPANVDFALYQEQIVEADARQIAELVINKF